MKTYELLFILGEKHAEAKARDIAKQVEKELAKQGGKVKSTNLWGKKKLAYPIKDNTYGYYFITVFDAEGPTLDVVSREFNLDPEIIRYLITDYIEGSEIPSDEAEKTNKGTHAKAEKLAEDASDVVSQETPVEEEAAKPKRVAKKAAPKDTPKDADDAPKSTLPEDAPLPPAPEEKPSDLADAQEAQKRKLMMDDETRRNELDKKLDEFLGQ